jgi:hypothetical protein
MVLVESVQQETNCYHRMKTSAWALLLLLTLEVFAENPPSLRLMQNPGAESPNTAVSAGAAKEETPRQPTAQANPLPYLTNAVCVFDADQGWTVRFTIQGGVADVSYGIFRTTALKESAPTWELLGEGYSGKTHVFNHQPGNQAFYALGDLATGPLANSAIQAASFPTAESIVASEPGAMSQTTRNASLPASWLARHFGANWRTNPAAAADADADGDGVSNLQEHRRGRNPLVRALADSGDRTKLRVYTLLIEIGQAGENQEGQ